MTPKTLLMQNTIIVLILIAIFLGITTILTLATIEARNKKFTNSSITEKTSTNCNSAEIILMPKPNGGFIPVLIPSNHNCKENQDE